VRKRRIAWFVTPHGFGHAARACAVIEALGERMPLALELFTTVPEWFFAASLKAPFGYHAVRCDIGLAQRDAMDEDLDATVRELDAFLPWPAALVDGLAEAVRARDCEAVICDVAPLGIAVARAAGVPAALVENFTWDWIYESYVDRVPALARHAAELARWFAAADLRVQTEPRCRPWPGAVVVPPVARLPRRSRDDIRRELGIEPGQRVVLVTMGGIPWDYAAMVAGGGPRLPGLPEGVVLVVPAGAAEPRRLPWARLLPFHSELYHPDLVAAADAVIGKLGYSTLAECWCSGVPFGFVPRPSFPESPVLAAAITNEGAGVEVSADALTAASWGWLEGVLAVPRVDGGRRRGNAQAASAIAEWLGD
jgi:UDP:flavonoid glycosyltransferase YjiC (YdhE family)